MTEHEKTLLSQILEKPELYHEVSVDSQHFSDAYGRRVFNALGAVINAGTEPDMVALRDADKNIPAATLSSLQAATTANWKYYEGQVRKAYAGRKLHELGTWLSEFANSEEATEHVEEVLSEVTAESTGDKIHARRDLVHAYVNELERRFQTGGVLPGLSSGFAELDGIILGFQPRRYYLIGGRPSRGKSALALNMADYMSVVQSVTIGYITLESAKEELMDRTFANLGNIDSNSLATGKFFDRDFKTITEVGERVFSSHMYVYEVANARLEQVVSAARQMVRRYGCEVLFIDYVQLIRSAGDRTEQAQRGSMAMKELARQLNVPVIAAAQLRRDVDNRRPGLGDFQHSSQMEQDADTAMLLHDDADEGCTWLYVEKNRDGEKGSVRLKFRGSYVRFEQDFNER